MDLIFSTDPDNVVLREALVPLSKVDKDYHEPIEFTHEFADDDQLSSVANAQFYDFKNADFDGFNRFLCNMDWERSLEGYDLVDDAVDFFYQKISDGLERFVPVLSKPSDSPPPWYTRTIINLKNRKSRAYKKLSRSHNPADQMKYSALNREFETKQLLAYQSWMACRMVSLTIHVIFGNTLVLGKSLDVLVGGESWNTGWNL